MKNKLRPLYNISETIPSTEPENAPGRVREGSFHVMVHFKSDNLSAEQKPFVKFTWEYAKCQGESYFCQKLFLFESLGQNRLVIYCTTLFSECLANETTLIF